MTEKLHELYNSSPHKLRIEFTIWHCLIFGTAWYDPTEIDIIVNLFILNNFFMIFHGFIRIKYTRGTRFFNVQKKTIDVCTKIAPSHNLSIGDERFSDFKYHSVVPQNNWLIFILANKCDIKNRGTVPMQES